MIMPNRSFPRRTLLLVALLALLLRPFLAPAAAADPKEVFTVVLLPDTQFYSEKYPDTYVQQTLWIRSRVKEDNLKFSIGLGDIVQNAKEEQEWKNANVAASHLDGVLPYSIVPGNHDLRAQDMGRSRDSSLFNKYFPAARFEGEKWYGGHMGHTNDNNFCFFEGAGKKFLVLSLEFAPRNETLAWAADVCRKHPQHNVIVATHSYLGLKARVPGPEKDYKLQGNGGDEMWDKFVRKEPNIFMVVCGHIGGVNMQVTRNDFGDGVIELLTDYQNLKNGGDGWLRTMKFVPAENKIYVTAWSPLLKEYNNDPKHTHTIDLDFAKLR
jgi:hypothetical protein